MASTYSTNLKLELIATGEQSGTWGSTTNTNLGTLLEQAIAGYVTQAVTDGAATVLTIPDGASSNGRNYVIELTGTLSANRTVEVPAVDKPYIFFNNTSGGFSVTVKVSGQTGVAIANGKKAIVYTNSTDVIEVANAPVTEAGTQTLSNKSFSTNTTFSADILMSGTGQLDLAAGTTAQRTGSPTSGMIRFNTTQTAFEGYDGTRWAPVGNVPRVTSTTSAASITPDADTTDQYQVTAQAAALAINIPSGTAYNGQKLLFRLKDNGTARALTWTTSAGGYRVIGVTLPTTTVINKVTYVGCIYNSQDSFWDVVAVTTQV